MTEMKRVFLITILLWLCAQGAMAVGVKPGSVKTLVDSCGFFPQLSPDGKWLLYSPTEATSLMLKNLSTGAVTVIANEGYPGFDGIFGADGKVYYVTQQRKKNGMVYRTGHCYDPVTGKDKVVLKAQHGRVQALRATRGVVINGEKQIYCSAKRVGAYCYTRGDKLYLVDDAGTTRSLQPVKDSNGYLWASLSPDGTRVMFEASSRGLYVCDLNGTVISELGQFLMPCWYNNDYVIAMSNVGNVRLTGSRIWLLSLDGDVCKPLTDRDERAVQPMVSGDKVVYSVIYDGTVKQLSIDRLAAIVPEVVSHEKGRTEKVKSAAGKKDVPRVFINPGHGGHDSDDRHMPTWVIGEQDTLHYYESNSNLTKGLALKEILENKGYETVISRQTNTTADDLDLFEIVSLAANSGADIFFAIHSNATGTEKHINFPLGLYRGWDGQEAVEGSLKLSQLVMKHLIGNQLTVWTAKERSRGDWSFYDWGYKVGLGVLRFNKLPGFLSEGSFHDYLPERERLLNDSYCWLEAWNQSLGIDEYFGRKGKYSNGVIAGTVRWSDLGRKDDSKELFADDRLQPVDGALLRLYNGRGSLSRVYTVDNRDNGVFVFTNLLPDKYKLELCYGGENLYITTKVKVKKNRSSYKNLTMSKNQKPKKK